MSHDNDNDKPSAPKGTVGPPIIRLDASRQDARQSEAIRAKSGERLIVENTKPPAPKPPGKQAE